MKIRELPTVRTLEQVAADLGVDIAEVRKLKPGQRAMVAVDLLNEQKKDLATLRKARRKRSATIRSRTPKGERQPCAVCLGFRPITQRHHLKPVANSSPEDAAALNTVWLCPNCHVIFHMYEKIVPATKEFADMLTPDQWKAMSEILQAGFA